MYEDQKLNRAIRWLHDWIDSDVVAEVVVERGDFRYSILSAAGVLRHWRGRLSAKVSRDDVAGLYEIGDGDSASLDLSNVLPDVVARRSEDEMEVEVAEGVWLRVVRTEEP